MREIKFRYWDLKNKEMWSVGELHWDVFRREIQINHSDGGLLMQYIGLKAKNGVEIYDGDILRSSYYNDVYNHGALGDVSYKDCSFRVSWKILFGENTIQKRDPISTICSHVITNAEDIRIVGNIYDDPDLLADA